MVVIEGVELHDFLYDVHRVESGVEEVPQPVDSDDPVRCRRVIDERVGLGWYLVDPSFLHRAEVCPDAFP